MALTPEFHVDDHGNIRETVQQVVTLPEGDTNPFQADADRAQNALNEATQKLEATKEVFEEAKKLADDAEKEVDQAQDDVHEAEEEVQFQAARSAAFAEAVQLRQELVESGEASGDAGTPQTVPIRVADEAQV